MRQEIRLNDQWRFYLGDIDVPRPADKGPAYTQSKTERKKIGPAAYHYYDRPDSYESSLEIRCDGWKTVSLPHDYIINQDNDPPRTMPTAISAMTTPGTSSISPCRRARRTCASCCALTAWPGKAPFILTAA